LALGQTYLGPMETTLREHTFASMGDTLRIIIEPSGNEVWARGAACVVLSTLFISVEQTQRAQPALAADRPASSPAENLDMAGERRGALQRRNGLLLR